MRSPNLPTILPLLLSPLANALPTEDCPLLGPIWPASTYDITASDAFADAKETFPQAIQALFDAQVIDNQTSTFALDVWSTKTNESIYQYFHVAEEGGQDTLSADVLNDQTVFRTGSVSKLHTVYAIILAAGGKNLDIFDEKVTKYVPELSRSEGEDDEDDDDALTRVNWDEITIGTLASHEGGTGGPGAEVAVCGCDAEGTSCDPSAAPECVKDFIKYMRDERRPVHPVYQTPTYSDGGYIILTQVLVSMTNMTYDAALKHYLAEPLGLNATATIAGAAQNANGVVLPGGFLQGSSWGVDQQAVAGSGGVYSNLADLRKLGLSILNYEILSPATTKQWMKPSGLLTTPYKAVGAPWEIERLAIPVAPNASYTRISDQYGKAGGQPGYTGVLLTSPDHGIGYTVLVAGPGAGGDRWPLRAALGEAFVTAAEWAGYEHAKAEWPGTYVEESTEGTNITLVVDSSKGNPGVRIDSIFVGGVDWRANLTTTAGTGLPGEALANLSAPLYPTGLAAGTKDGGQRLQFRAVPVVLPQTFPMDRTAIEGGSGLFDDACFSPFGTAGFYDLGEGSPIDEFVLVFDRDGVLESVEYPAQGANFVRAN